MITSLCIAALSKKPLLGGVTNVALVGPQFDLVKAWCGGRLKFERCGGRVFEIRGLLKLLNEKHGGNNDHSKHSKCPLSGLRAIPGSARSSSGVVIRPVDGAARPDAGAGLPPADGKLTVTAGACRR